MEWVKLVATPPYYLDGALLRAGEAAEVLFCRGLAYCGTVESEGRVDKSVLPMLITRGPQRAKALVREGLWLDMGDHYLVRTWEKWQDEHDAAAERRRKDRDRKRDERRRVRGLSVDGPADVSETSAECPALDVEVDVESPSDSARLPSSFDAWYFAYPRKVGKAAARKAHAKALKAVGPDVLLDAARRFAADPNLPETRFIPHPSTWLNEGRWDDEPLPAPSRPTDARIARAEIQLAPADEWKREWL